MKLKLNDSFQIVSDQYQYILQSTKTTNKNGVVIDRSTPKSLGFYGDIADCLHSYFLRFKLKDIDDVEVKDLLNELNKFRDELKTFNQ